MTGQTGVSRDLVRRRHGFTRDKLRAVFVLVPALIAVQHALSAHVPVYVRLLLILFGDFVPLLLIWASAISGENRDAERRRQRDLTPRPRVIFGVLAAAWAVIGGGLAVAAWAAGARSTVIGGGEGWIAAVLVWATTISGCSLVAILGCALTAGAPEQPRREPATSGL